MRSNHTAADGDELPWRGRVDRTQVRHLKRHELDTAERLAGLGYDVTFLAPAAGEKSPDALIDGEVWELKSPTGASTGSVTQLLRRARKQARRVVIDLERSPLRWAAAISAAHAAFERYDELAVVWVVRGQRHERIRR